MDDWYAAKHHMFRNEKGKNARDRVIVEIQHNEKTMEKQTIYKFEFNNLWINTVIEKIATKQYIYFQSKSMRDIIIANYIDRYQSYDESSDDFAPVMGLVDCEKDDFMRIEFVCPNRVDNVTLSMWERRVHPKPYEYPVLFN